VEARPVRAAGQRGLKRKQPSSDESEAEESEAAESSAESSGSGSDEDAEDSKAKLAAVTVGVCKRVRAVACSNLSSGGHLAVFTRDATHRVTIAQALAAPERGWVRVQWCRTAGAMLEGKYQLWFEEDGSPYADFVPGKSILRSFPALENGCVPADVAAACRAWLAALDASDSKESEESSADEQPAAPAPAARGAGAAGAGSGSSARDARAAKRGAGGASGSAGSARDAARGGGRGGRVSKRGRKQ
jgi:hypothetical protein